MHYVHYTIILFYLLQIINVHYARKVISCLTIQVALLHVQMVIILKPQLEHVNLASLHAKHVKAHLRQIVHNVYQVEEMIPLQESARNVQVLIINLIIL